jgi:phosphoribosylamine-glycine ligase
MLAAAEGSELPKAGLKTHPGAAMVVVLAAGGYPGAYPKGTPITLPPSVPENSAIIHAGTELDDSQTLVNNGGRILGVSAQAKDLQSAANLAYTVCDQIDYSGKYFRRDIGHRELNRQPPAESDYARPL